MMENAGHGIADFIVSKFSDKLKNKKIVIVCGTGNNGGDGFVSSRHLEKYCSRLTVILLGSPTELRTKEARINWGILEKMDSIEVIFAKEIGDDIRAKISGADIIIDGIFGTGIRGEICEPHSTAIDLINDSGAYTVAVDIPSGFDPNTGKIHDKCVRADATITFHRMKTGLLNKRTKGRSAKSNKSNNKKQFTGAVIVEHIGIPSDAEIGIVG